MKSKFARQQLVPVAIVRLTLQLWLLKVHVYACVCTRKLYLYMYNSCTCTCICIYMYIVHVWTVKCINQIGTSIDGNQKSNTQISIVGGICNYFHSIGMET